MLEVQALFLMPHSEVTGLCRTRPLDIGGHCIVILPSVLTTIIILFIITLFAYVIA